MVEIKANVKIGASVYGLALNGIRVIEGYYAGNDGECHFMKHDGNIIVRIDPSGMHLTVKEAFEELDKRAELKIK